MFERLFMLFRNLVMRDDKSHNIYTRINKGTYWLKKRSQISGDLRRILLDIGQCTRQRGDKLLHSGEVAVMGGLHANVMPNSFDSIEGRTVRRQGDQVKAMTVTAKPLSDFRCLVVGGIIMDQENLLPTVTFSQAVEEMSISFSIKHLILREMKSRTTQFHRAKDLLRIALTGGRNEWLASAPGPGLI